MNATSRPTAVRVHGAFADASGFAGIIRELSSVGYAVIAPPNPLRGVASDASAVRAVVAGVAGPVGTAVGARLEHASNVVPNLCAGQRNIASCSTVHGEPNERDH